MKRFAWFALIFLVLIGCSNENVEETQNTKKENIEVSNSPQDKLSFPDLRPSNGSISDISLLDRSCWEGDDGEPCAKEPRDPEELLFGYGNKPMTISSGEVVFLDITYDATVSNVPPFPNKVTITQFPNGEKTGEVIAILDVPPYSFQAPEEPGRYYYRAHLQWNGEVVGEAYYAFVILVKEKN